MGGGQRQGRWRNWQTAGKQKSGQNNRQPPKKNWGSPGSAHASSNATAAPTAKQLAEWKARGWQDLSGASQSAGQAPTADRPVIPEVERTPEQTANTKRLWQLHQDAVRLRDMVERSDTCTPDILAMHNQRVSELRRRLDVSKPVEYLYAGQLKKVEQLAAKVQAARDDATKQWAAVDEQIETAQKADTKVKTLVQALHDTQALLPDMAQAAKAEVPKPKYERAFDDVIESIATEVQRSSDQADTASAATLRTMEQTLQALRVQFAAFSCARQAEHANKNRPKDSEGDDIMGGQQQQQQQKQQQDPPPATPHEPQTTQEASRSSPPTPTVPEATGQHQQPQQTDIVDLAAQVPEPSEPAQSTDTGNDEQIHQQAMLAKAQQVAAKNKCDTEEVASLRSALRGRLHAKPVDVGFLQQGIDCVEAAVQKQYNDVGPSAPTAKNQRTDDLPSVDAQGTTDDL